ncbi:MAG: HD domain-containing protein [Patescibacteria group bacterium]|nr:HD domain-containing protein [Patescibacteria group bacterium]
MAIKEKIVKRIKKIAKERMEEINDPVHSWDHIKKVVKYSKELLKKYPQADQFVVLMSAYLHDIGEIEKKKHNVKGADISKEILQKLNLDKQTIIKVQHVIKEHSVEGKPKIIEGKIIRDADHLDWINTKRLKAVLSKLTEEEIEKEVKPYFLKLRDLLDLPESKVMFDELYKKHKKRYERLAPHLIK